MDPKQYISWEEVEESCSKIAKWAEDLQSAGNFEFSGIWGPARGGWIPGVILSHKLNLKVFTEPRVRPLLIVDDITDTGGTLHSYSTLDGIYIATIFYHRQSSFEPDKWIHEKQDKWIVYPWESK